ncbi:porin family protein [Pseudanabaena biceps]|nr:porin family protein [Pseudanabaena biceps]
MKNPTNLTKILVSLTALGCTSAIAVPSAQSQPAYGSYLGAGASFGFTSGNSSAGESSRTSALIAARYKFLEFPISLRTQILIGNSTAVVPTISFDVPLNFDTDVYIGAGVALSNTVDTTPVGNKNSFVIQPGIDYTLPNSNLVLFSNVIFAFDAYRNSSGTSATSLQTGLGLRF